MATENQVAKLAFTSHFYELTFISGGGRDGGGETAKPVTAVRDCVSMFVGMKPLVRFDEEAVAFSTFLSVTLLAILERPRDNFQLRLLQ